MSPNLLILAKKVVQPFKLFKSKEKFNNTHKLHYRHEPVPGIYAITSNNKIYLVAIRPHKKKDVEQIFQSPKRDLEETTSGKFTCEQSTKTQPTYRSSPVATYSTISLGSGSTDCAMDHARSTKFTGVPITGSIHHRKRSIRHSNSSSSTSFLKSKHSTLKITAIDMNGYKFLQRPLKVEYNSTVRRWMFSTEVRLRTILTPMCVSLNCMQKTPGSCGASVWRELFVLDDGCTYVVTSDVNRRKGRSVKHGEKEPRIFYCTDKQTGFIRRQSVKEVEASRERLARRDHLFLVDDGDADYMPVVRYCQWR